MSAINWQALGSSPEYVIDRVRRYNEQPSDDLLYRIGTHVDALDVDTAQCIDRYQNGRLTPYQRYQVLDWIAKAGLVIEGDLALLIFGRNQLEEWLEISRQVYPNFEFYLVFEFHPNSFTGWETGINFSLFWMPKDGAPVPDPGCDFPWKLNWDCGEMFWGDRPNSCTNDFDFTLSCYPSQQSFAKPGWFCEEGDYYTTPSDEEASLMPVVEVLKHFTIPV